MSLPMAISIDRNINDVENALSKAAAVPVLGAIPAAVKVAMGILQTVTFFVTGVTAGLVDAALGDTSLLKYSFTHVVHGLGNIVAGTIEAIPLVGTAVQGVRMWKSVHASVQGIKIYNPHEEKFLPYHLLEIFDWELSSIDEREKASTTNKILDLARKEFNVKFLNTWYTEANSQAPGDICMKIREAWNKSLPKQ